MRYAEYAARFLAMLGTLALSVVAVAHGVPAAGVLLLLGGVAAVLPWRSL